MRVKHDNPDDLRPLANKRVSVSECVVSAQLCDSAHSSRVRTSGHTLPPTGCNSRSHRPIDTAARARRNAGYSLAATKREMVTIIADDPTLLSTSSSSTSRRSAEDEPWATFRLTLERT